MCLLTKYTGKVSARILALNGSRASRVEGELMVVLRAFVVLCVLFLGLPAAATSIGFTATLNDAPSQATFPTVFPAGQTISGSFTFADPAQTAPPYDVGVGAVVGQDELAGSNQALFRGIASFSILIPGYGTVTGTGGQVFAFNPFSASGTETFRIAAGGTVPAPFDEFGGTVTGPNVPLTSGSATLVGAFLEVQSNQDVLSGQFVDDAANVLINNLAGWNVRTDKQIRLSFSNPAAPNQTIEVDYTLNSSFVLPEPTTGLLVGMALVMLAGMRRRA